MKVITLFIFFISLFYGKLNNFDGEIIEYISKYRIDSTTKNLYKKNSYVIKINNKDGNYLSNISIPYQVNNPIITITGKIKDNSGNTVRELKNSEIKDRNFISSFSFYEDYFVKEFSLNYNKYPYFIEYSYTVKEKDFFQITSWSPLLYSKIPTKKAKFVLETPIDYSLNFKTKDIPKGKIDTILKKKVYTWETKYDGLLKEEELSPTLEELMPMLNIVPESFVYGTKGKSNTWQEFGNWKYRLNKDLDILSKSEKTKIRSIIEYKNTPKEKAKALYYYMQDNTRYVNVSLNIGGLQTYPAEYVCKNKYGDCKALSNYMKAVLYFAGINSYFSNIYAGEEFKEIDKSFPSQQFNHVILCVPFEKDTVWLECTEKNIPFGYLGTFTQNRNAFLVDQKNSRFVRTPKLSTKNVLNSGKIIIWLSDNINNSKAHINILLRGKKYEIINSYYHQYNKRKQENLLYKILPFSDFEIKSWNIKLPNRDTAQISVEADLLLKNFINKYENSIYFKIPKLNLPKLEKPDKRIHSLKIAYPINKIDTVVVKNISAYNFKQKQNLLFETKFGLYKLTYNIVNDELIIIRNYILNEGKYETKLYSEFYNFIKKIKRSERRNNIVLTLK